MNAIIVHEIIASIVKKSESKVQAVSINMKSGKIYTVVLGNDETDGTVSQDSYSVLKIQGPYGTRWIDVEAIESVEADGCCNKE